MKTRYEYAVYAINPKTGKVALGMICYGDNKSDAVAHAKHHWGNLVEWCDVEAWRTGNKEKA